MDHDFQKFLDHDIQKFKDHDYQKFKEVCFLLLDFFDKKRKKTQLKNIYFPYSKHIILQWWITQREERLRERKIKPFQIKKKKLSLEYATRKALRGQYLCSFELWTDLPLG